ncbi:MAG: hypothetical protein ABIE84_06835 [bacterium]
MTYSALTARPSKRLGPPHFTQSGAPDPRHTRTIAATISRNLRFFSPVANRKTSRPEMQFVGLLEQIDLKPNQPLYHLLSFRTYLLKDVLSQGYITLTDAYKLLVGSLSLSAQDITDNWERNHDDFLRELIAFTPLARELPQLRDKKLLAAEFFLRKGAIGLYNFASYGNFYRNLQLTGAPAYLRDGYAKALWLEMHSQAGLPITDRALIESYKQFSYNCISTEEGKIWGAISLAEPSDLDEHCLGVPVEFGIRCEMGHWLELSFDSGTVAAKRFAPVIREWHDRGNSVNYSPQVDAPKIQGLYTQLFGAYQELSLTVLRNVSATATARKLIDQKIAAKPTGYKDFFMSNARLALEQTEPANSLYNKICGEGIFYSLPIFQAGSKTEARLTKQLGQEAMQAIKTISRLRQQVEGLPEDVRVFYEGGNFMSTHDFAFPSLSTPRANIFGARPSIFRSGNEHSCAEWLDFILRQRIGSMLIKGLRATSPRELHRAAILYLTSLFNHGATIENIIEVTRYLSEGEVCLFLGSALDGCTEASGRKYHLRREADKLESKFRAGRLRFTTLLEKFTAWQAGPYKEFAASGADRYVYPNLPFYRDSLGKFGRKRPRLLAVANDPKQPMVERRLAAYVLLLRRDESLIGVRANDPVINAYKIMLTSAQAHQWGNFAGDSPQLS